MNQLEYRDLEEKERQFYSQYNKFISERAWPYLGVEDESYLDIVDAFKINIGKFFFYYIYQVKHHGKSFTNFEQLIYNENNFEQKEIQDTYLNDFLFMFKLNHSSYIEEGDAVTKAHYDWYSVFDEYHRTKSINNKLRLDEIKGIELQISENKYKQLLTIKAIPSEILEPLAESKEKFIFNMIERDYIEKLNICTGLFFLHDWNWPTLRREYFFLITDSSPYMFEIILSESDKQKKKWLSIEKEKGILDAIGMLHFVFEQGRCTVNEYKCKKLGDDYILYIDKVERFENTKWFESYIAGLLIFSMEIKRERSSILLDFIDENIYKYEYQRNVTSYWQRQEYHKIEENLQINYFYFYLGVYPEKKYCLRSHIDEIYDRHKLYYAIRQCEFMSDYDLRKCSENTFVSLKNSDIMLKLVRPMALKLEREFPDKSEYKSDNYMSSHVGMILQHPKLYLKYKYEGKDHDWSRRDVDDWGQIFYDSNRPFRNELIKKVFYEINNNGYKYE